MVCKASLSVPYPHLSRLLISISSHSSCLFYENTGTTDISQHEGNQCGSTVYTNWWKEWEKCGLFWPFPHLSTPTQPLRKVGVDTRVSMSKLAPSDGRENLKGISDSLQVHDLSLPVVPVYRTPLKEVDNNEHTKTRKRMLSPCQ